MTEEKPRLCPFCGNEPTWITFEANKELKMKTAYQIECHVCYVAGTAIFTSRKMALFRWNNRNEKELSGLLLAAHMHGTADANEKFRKLQTVATKLAQMVERMAYNPFVPDDVVGALLAEARENGLLRKVNEHE
jgi:hypothetical protein